MLYNAYDSYGYKETQAFITTAERKGVKFKAPKNVEQHLTEIGSFYSEAGQPTGDLNQSPILYKELTPVPFNYRTIHLTFEILEDGNIYFNFNNKVTVDLLPSVSYSMDDGETWTEIVNSGTTVIVPIPVQTGDIVKWKGNVKSFGVMNGTSPAFSYFTSDCRFNAYGNLMSLCYGDNFLSKKTLTYDCQFAGLFYGATNYGGCGCKLVDASNLILQATKLTFSCYRNMFRNNNKLIAAPQLPATELGKNCYHSMFYECASLTTPPKLPAKTLNDYCYFYLFGKCTSLTTAPELPATTLADYCYYCMFHTCTSLTEAPELPATKLVSHCYRQIFHGCTSLTAAPELPATTLADGCYVYMFNGCTSLTTAPELPVTTLKYSCYAGMFYNCTSLTTAPELPATTMATYCYDNMFQGCTSLTTAPELPATTLAENCYHSTFLNCTSLTEAPVLSATTLANYCYSYMFQGCTSLTTAPELQTQILADGCYYNMFYNCPSLNYVKCLATDISASACTENWLTNVSQTGVFVKAEGMEDWSTGPSGIPSGWTVYEGEYVPTNEEHDPLRLVLNGGTSSPVEINEGETEPFGDFVPDEAIDDNQL